MLALALTTTLLAAAPAAQESVVRPLTISVTHDGSVGDQLSGRLYIMLTQGRRPPISGPNWFGPEPFFAMDVTDWSANDPLVVADQAIGMDGPISTLPDGKWGVQALLRRNPDTARLVTDGAVHSDITQFVGSGVDAGEIALAMTTVIQPRTWKPHERLRLVEVPSEMLSDFHGRQVKHGACVIVPKDWDPDRAERYPVLFWIGGFHSDHYGGRYMKPFFGTGEHEDKIARVVLNAQCYGGHHVFADSPNNGPRMAALIEEFIPLLESQFNIGGSSKLRYLAGHSSGGWSSLWLQLNAPGFFNGTWSFAPDPIDFSDFQGIDLYAPGANMYRDEAGERRPIARMGERPVVWYDSFTAMDDVIGDGGQIHSFDWAFSQRGEDGTPRYMFDHETGAVDPDVMESWKAFDIRRLMENRWETLSRQIDGKIVIVAGGLDTFYLEGPVESLSEWIDATDVDMELRVIEGADHGAVFQPRLLQEMDRWIMQRTTRQ